MIITRRRATSSTPGARALVNISLPLAIDNRLELKPAVIRTTAIHVYVYKPVVVTISEI